MTASISEKEKAQEYLTRTRDGITAAVEGLAEEKWKFKPAADRWSVAEVVEHLALIEGVVTQKILPIIGTAPAPGAGWDAGQIDAMILVRVPDRSRKGQAPEPARPTGRWTGPEALEVFLTGRARTMAMLEASGDLRGHVIDHPVFGPLDGYHWVLAVAAHSDRHLQQILEVKAEG